MVSLANDSFSCDISEKGPSAPKYKPRKVNAKREFPPRCGSSAVKNFKPVENFSSGDDANDAKKVNSVVNDVGISGGACRMESEAPVNPSDGGMGVEVINPMMSQKKIPGLLDAVDSRDVEDSADVMKNLTKNAFANADVMKELKIDFSADEEVIACNSSNQFSTLKHKYSRRKASAVREFPPRCGGNALVPDQLKLTETSGTDFWNVVEEVKVESGATGSTECKKDPQVSSLQTEARRDVCKSGTMHEESFAAASESTERTKGKEIVVLPVEKIKINSSPDDSMMKNGSQREIVQALKAEPYCPWRKGKVNVTNSDCGASGVYQLQNAPLSSPSSFNDKPTTTVCPEDPDTDGFCNSENLNGNEDNSAFNEGPLDVLPVSVCMPVLDKNDDNSSRSMRDFDHSPGEGDDVRSDGFDREIVQCLMAEPHCPWRKRKRITKKPDGRTCIEKELKPELFPGVNPKPFAKESIPKSKILGWKNKKRVRTLKDIGASSGALVPANDQTLGLDKQSPSSIKQRSFEVSLPPFGANASGCSDARNKVRQTLRLFSAICRKLLHAEEAHSLPDHERKPGEKKLRRIDLEATAIMKREGMGVNTDKIYLGEVPGVEVGDEFQYRVELAVVGIHRLFQSGIDSMKLNGVPVAVSVVASGAYADDVENADVLIYSGQGGNIVGKAKMRPEDQKLERGNLALKNSISMQNAVRVIRGWKETRVVDPLDPRPKVVTTYVYDGLYTVKNYWPETGPHGKRVYMFELRRNPGQPELAWKQLKKPGKSKIRTGVCVEDISQGQEPIPISAVNTLNDEKPSPFNYVPKIKYPDWFHPIPLPGCDCTGRCSDSKKCRCAILNGGEISYNRNGALVETKSMVYECGPLCKCPPSCYNRVAQRGIKIQLEIFKTESRGWGVRALSSIPSGSFICEYAGELLEDREAEERIGSDEYLFDIGRNYIDSPHRHDEDEVFDAKMEGGYTIDAAEYGNIGRFVNHSCLPNLYAQNVLFDHNDTRMPHIMLFALENIPPLQELTYDYNYSMGQIEDSDGNIKVKKCFCGAAQCTGRLY